MSANHKHALRYKERLRYVRERRMRCTYAVGRTGEISSVDSDEFGSGVLMKLHEYK